MTDTNEQIRIRLAKLSDDKYKEFYRSLEPSQRPILGVRMPLLRKLAKEISHQDWQQYLEEASAESYEEAMLQGLVLAYSKMPLTEQLRRITNFLPIVDGWGICDGFCSTLRMARKHPQEVWEYLETLKTSTAPFTLRFVIVMWLDYYLTDLYIDQVLDRLNTIQSNAYYVKMAVAWAIATATAHFPDKSIAFLQNCQLDSFTYHKALQKIRESRQTPPEVLQQMPALKALKPLPAARRNSPPPSAEIR